MDNQLTLKTDHLNNFLDGTIYLINKSYDIVQYIGSIFTPMTEVEKVDQGLNDLYAVKEEVNSREQILRYNVSNYLLRAKEFTKKNMKREARIMIKLYMLYDAQVSHCQTTLTAIESHIISLENVSLNKKVCNAFKSSNYVNGFETIDESILEDAVEKLDDRNVSANEFARTLGEVPCIEIDERMIEDELKKIEYECTEHTIDTTQNGPLLELPTAPTGPILMDISSTNSNTNTNTILNPIQTS